MMIDEGEAMRSVIYASTATRLLDPTEQMALEAQSEGRNAMLGLTGLLLYNGHCFLQLLEGDADPLQTVMASIARDSRHRAITILRNEPCAAAECPGWAMRLLVTPLARTGSMDRFVRELPMTMALATRQMFAGFVALQHAPHV